MPNSDSQTIPLKQPVLDKIDNLDTEIIYLINLFHKYSVSKRHKDPDSVPKDTL